jgi:hypothetical protein
MRMMDAMDFYLFLNFDQEPIVPHVALTKVLDGA